MSARSRIRAAAVAAGALALALVALVVLRHRQQPCAEPTQADLLSRPVKEAIVALFAVRPGVDEPPALPQLDAKDREILPLVLEALTEADGCDPATVRREFEKFMRMGGHHAQFLEAYREKLLFLRSKNAN